MILENDFNMSLNTLMYRKNRIDEEIDLYVKKTDLIKQFYEKIS